MAARQTGLRKVFAREHIARDQPKHGHWDVILALWRLSRYTQKSWFIVRQVKLLELVKHVGGRVISRRTLNRHLLWWEQRGVINRTQRHMRGPRSRTFIPRPSMYTFGIASPLWISRVRDAAEARVGRLRVPNLAHSEKPFSIGQLKSKCAHCGAPLAVRNGINGPRGKPRGNGGPRRPTRPH